MRVECISRRRGSGWNSCGSRWFPNQQLGSGYGQPWLMDLSWSTVNTSGAWECWMLGDCGFWGLPAEPVKSTRSKSQPSLLRWCDAWRDAMHRFRWGEGVSTVAPERRVPHEGASVGWEVSIWKSRKSMEIASWTCDITMEISCSSVWHMTYIMTWHDSHGCFVKTYGTIIRGITWDYHPLTSYFDVYKGGNLTHHVISECHCEPIHELSRLVIFAMEFGEVPVPKFSERKLKKRATGRDADSTTMSIDKQIWFDSIG